MRILAIDPGTTESGVVVYDAPLRNRTEWNPHAAGWGVVEAVFLDNPTLIHRMKERSFGGAEVCAIEMIACYGMAVGKETFETCVWIGRFVERAGIPVHLIYRQDVKIHLCGTMKAKDPNIRQALIDKHGAPGTKKKPGPTYGIAGHLWSALAVADYAAHILHPNQLPQ